MSKDISFLIPTMRHYESGAGIVVQDIQSFMEDTDLSYEILIYSEFEVQESLTVRWIPEKVRTYGPVLGYNTCFQESKGRYIYLTNDKWHMNEKCLKAIDLFESDEFKSRKFKATSINAPANMDYSITAMPMIGSQSAPQLDLPPELQHPRFLEDEYKYPIFGFPVLERDTVVNHLSNYVLHPDFRTHYHDNWLSFYIGEYGEFPLLCEDTQMTLFGGGTSAGDDSDDYKVFAKLAANLINRECLVYV